MEKIIKLWRVFIRGWFDGQIERDVGNRLKGKLKPSFYDFMEFLSKEDINLSDK